MNNNDKNNAFKWSQQRKKIKWSQKKSNHTALT